MARLFGALANAGAQYNKGRFAREQYDAEQQKIARDEARRAFEFGAMNDRLLEQARQAAQDREDARIQSAMNQGFEEDRDAGAIRGASAALGAFTGFQGNAAGATSPEDAPYKTNVEGIPIESKKIGSQYMTIGGKTLRRNRQRDENAIKADQASKLMAEFAMKRDVAQENARVRAEAQGHEARLLEAAREANRPQRKYGKYFTNPKTGQMLWVDEGENPPDGFLLATGGQGGAGGMSTAQRNVEINRMKSAYEADPAVKRASGIAGPVRQIEASLALDTPMSNLSAVYETIKLFDPQTGVREGETKLFANVASLPQRAARLLRVWNSGRILTPEMREDIRALMEEKKAAASADVPDVQARTGERLRRLGLEADSAYVAPNPLGGNTPRMQSPIPGSPTPNSVPVPWTTKKGG